MSKVQQFTAAEVSRHHSASSAWIVRHGRVYDVTRFLYDHPGGEEFILQRAGGDITGIMEDPLEHSHSDSAYDMLEEYFIGLLVDDKGNPYSTTSNSKVVSGEPKWHGASAEDKIEKFIDVNKPMVAQVWRAKWTKEYYLKQVHIPRHAINSAPIFGGVLEIFTLTPWWVIPTVWGPISLFCLYKGLFTVPVWSIPILWTLGVVNWSLIEYTLHRFLFHMDKLLPDHQAAFTLHFLLHGIHHYLPMDSMRLVMPPVLLAALSIPVWMIYLSVIPVWLAWPIASGTYFGYISYDLVHYYLHHGKPSGHFRDMKTYHLDHHYKNADLGFGITSKIWDQVFGTELLP
ncbi:hypothetical protein SmJEL517_g03238 [Synchytrium microbalum]|uniref:Ceramide very long chain fatty acid hydroxylase n=1 Tax=Synchytrium microbalum TaxID=1806994 RepID=A0A507BZ29_9FUNG|nr:uncharacterized protein SmJEL517_g03238 [Synchytrium microbalum]TPX34057.1 hypothetical protein SmJEL517_g03238 [Synchytrium microbalum]